MATELDTLEAAALKLPANERAAFAQRLLTSLDPEADEVWAVEVHRRIVEIESGVAPLIPIPEALAQVRASIRIISARVATRRERERYEEDAN